MRQFRLQKYKKSVPSASQPHILPSRIFSDRIFQTSSNGIICFIFIILTGDNQIYRPLRIDFLESTVQQEANTAIIRARYFKQFYGIFKSSPFNHTEGKTVYTTNTILWISTARHAPRRKSRRKPPKSVWPQRATLQKTNTTLLNHEPTKLY